MTTTFVDLLRHGEPEGGPMFCGHIDHPLSHRGWRQMEATLSAGEQWDVVLTSPLLRCAAFASTVGASLNVPVHQDVRLREIGFGAWEGHTTDQVAQTWGEALHRFWGDPVAYRPPGGEPLDAFQSRVMQAWEHWTATLSGQRILLVCHGGVIRTLLAAVMEIPLEASFRVLAVPYASRSRVRLDDTPHGPMACLLSHGPSHDNLLESQG